MFRILKSVSVLLFAVALLSAQTPTEPSDIVRVGPGVTPPRLTRKVEPEYSSTARADRIQGTVLLLLVVNDRGKPVDITVMSPLGFGLDEQAVAAVSKWEFKPGMRNGQPVNVMATIEVNFRFPEIWFDAKAERQRTTFNGMLSTLQRPGLRPADAERAVQSMIELANQKFAPAMYVAGTWMLDGQRVPKDPARGLELIQKAADKNYGPALYEVAFRRLHSAPPPADESKGLDEMRAAATLGSRSAQAYLGRRYEEGIGVPRELDRARRYYRLCAAQGDSLCQFRLGRMLFNTPNRPERDYLQGIALFRLAASHGLPEAEQAAAAEASKLNAEQESWVKRLQTQLVRK